MKKKIFIIQSFLKHILYTSLVHQTPLRMCQIAPNCTIFSKFFWGATTPQTPPRKWLRLCGARLVQPLAMCLQPLAKILVESPVYVLCINLIQSDAVVFRYNLSEEVEKARNLDVLLSKTKEQLTRKDAQYTEWVSAVNILNLSGR